MRLVRRLDESPVYQMQSKVSTEKILQCRSLFFCHVKIPSGPDKTTATADFTLISSEAAMFAVASLISSSPSSVVFQDSLIGIS